MKLEIAILYQLKLKIVCKRNKALNLTNSTDDDCLYGENVKVVLCVSAGETKYD